jgi:hypothetical protein
MRNLAAVALLALLPAAATAADPSGTYYTPPGVGVATCPQFQGVRDRARQTKGAIDDQNNLQLFAAYVTGYQTAFNLLMPQTCDIFAGLSPDQVMAWLDNYCRGQPRQNFAAAVIALAEANHPARTTVCK